MGPWGLALPPGRFDAVLRHEETHAIHQAPKKLGDGRAEVDWLLKPSSLPGYKR